jgi:hypothetical protein
MACGRKEHAQEDARKRLVIEAKENNALQWQTLASLQAQVAEVSRALSAHHSGEKATAERREQHSRLLAHAEVRLALPEAILRTECEAAIRVLHQLDCDLHAEELRKRAVVEEEAACRFEGEAASRWSAWDDDCLPDDILAAV